MFITFIDSLELISEMVADWAVEQIEAITEALSPDGRPFGMRALTEQEQLAEYLLMRGNEEAWSKWINDRALGLIEQLEGSGISPDKVAVIQPFDIVASFAVDYSARMETLIKERSNGTANSN